MPIVGLEPSCVCRLPRRAAEPLPARRGRQGLARQTFTLGEFLDKTRPTLRAADAPPQGARARPLPSQVDHAHERRGRRPRAARRSISSSPTRAAAAWPARSDSRRTNTTSRSPPASACCCRRCARPTRHARHRRRLQLPRADRRPDRPRRAAPGPGAPDGPPRRPRRRRPALPRARLSAARPVGPDPPWAGPAPLRSGPGLLAGGALALALAGGTVDETQAPE